MKTAEIHLPYFKQGDDLSHHLANTKNTSAALEAHARQMEEVAKLLRLIKAAIEGQNVEIDADTHVIQIDGPDAVIERLIEQGLAEMPEYDDEEDYAEADERDCRWRGSF